MSCWWIFHARAAVARSGQRPPEAVTEAQREGGKPLPTTHSATYYPAPEPTIKTGVLTMSMAVLYLLSAND